MRLTNNLRAAFIRAVMNDVPETDNDAITREFQDALLKAMPKDEREFYNRRPRALATVYRSGNHLTVGSLSLARIKNIEPPFIKRYNARYNVERDLRSAVEGINTVKKLKEVFPELAKYTVDETEPTKNLPVLGGVTATLTALGWPKGEQKEDTAGANK